jgi:DNA polymerase-3 subunit alpha
VARTIVEERERNGPYRDLDDFMERIQPPHEQVVLLIRADAFRFTGRSRKALLWEAHMFKAKGQQVVAARRLFLPDTKPFRLP